MTIRHILPVYLVLFFGFFGYSLMITLFTPMLIRAEGGLIAADTPLGVRTVLLGVLLSLYPLGQFFGSPIMGALSDRFGRRPILLLSLMAAVVFYVLIALAIEAASFYFLCVASLLAGAAEANIVIAQSAIADTTLNAQRSRYFGYIYVSISLAYVVGPLLGGQLAGATGNAAPFWLTAALMLLTLLGVAALFRETLGPHQRARIHYWRMLAGFFVGVWERRLRRFYLVNFLLYLAIFGYFRCYPMYLVDEFHMGVSRLSWFIAYVGVPIVLANLGLTNFLAQRTSAKRMTVVSALCVGIFMGVIVAPPQIWWLWITLFLASLAVALALPFSASLLSLSALEPGQGRVLGINQSLAVAGEALSGLIGGALAAAAVELPLFVLGGFAIVAGLLALTLRQPAPSPGGEAS